MTATFKSLVQQNEQFIKEFNMYTNDEIVRMVHWIDPQKVYVVGYVLGWRSNDALYDR